MQKKVAMILIRHLVSYYDKIFPLPIMLNQQQSHVKYKSESRAVVRI